MLSRSLRTIPVPIAFLCASLGSCISITEKPGSGPESSVRPAAYPLSVVSPAACALGGKIYVTGGWGARTALGEADFVARAYRFDPDANAWERLPDMPRGRCFHACVAAGGRVWVLGGFRRGPEGQKNIAEVDCFDPETGEWSTPTRMPTPRNRLQALACDGEIWVACGMDDEGDTALVEVLDPEALSWRQAPPVPARMHGLAFAHCGTRLLVAGGSQTLRDTWLYDPQRDSWSAGPELPEPRLFASAVGHENGVYLLGNRRMGDIPLLYFDGDTMRWEQLAPASIETHRTAAVLIRGAIYVIAGEGPRGQLARVSRYDLSERTWAHSDS